MKTEFFCCQCMRGDIHISQYGGGVHPNALCKMHKEIADKNHKLSKEKDLKEETTLVKKDKSKEDAQRRIVKKRMDSLLFDKELRNIYADAY